MNWLGGRWVLNIFLFCEYIALSQSGTALLKHFSCVPIEPVFGFSIVHGIAWLFLGSLRMDQKKEGNCNWDKQLSVRPKFHWRILGTKKTMRVLLCSTWQWWVFSYCLTNVCLCFTDLSSKAQDRVSFYYLFIAHLYARHFLLRSWYVISNKIRKTDVQED